MQRDSDVTGSAPADGGEDLGGAREEPEHTFAQDAISAFVHAPVAIAVCRADGVVTRTNEAMTELLGYSGPELLGRDLFRLVPADLVAGAVAACLSLQDGTADTVVHETRFTTRDERLLDVRVTTSAVRHHSTLRPHAIMHLEDITDRVALQRRLEHQASHDELTGLANRSHFLEQLRRAHARSHRHRQPLTVIYLDLDDFKKVNDVLGHAVGDRLLVAFAEHLRHNVRPEDVPARLGGDEFVVLCETTTRAEAALVIDRLTGSGSDTWAEDALEGTGAVHLNVSVSAGAATLTEAGITTSVETGTLSHDATAPEALLHAADQAMYAAKAGTGEPPAPRP